MVYYAGNVYKCVQVSHKLSQWIAYVLRNQLSENLKILLYTRQTVHAHKLALTEKPNGSDSIIFFVVEIVAAFG